MNAIIKPIPKVQPPTTISFNSTSIVLPRLIKSYNNYSENSSFTWLHCSVMGKRLGVSVLKLVLKIALISLCYDLFFVREFCLFRPGWAAERPPGRVDLTAARRVAEQLRKSAWDSLLDDHPIVPFFPAQDLERDLLHFRQLRKLHDVFAVEFHLAVLEIGRGESARGLAHSKTLRAVRVRSVRASICHAVVVAPLALMRRFLPVHFPSG